MEDLKYWEEGRVQPAMAESKVSRKAICSCTGSFNAAVPFAIGNSSYCFWVASTLRFLIRMNFFRIGRKMEQNTLKKEYDKSFGAILLAY